MPASKQWLSVPANVTAVLSLYRSPEVHRLQDIARMLHTMYANVREAVAQNVPEDERRVLAALRYSKAKTDGRNAMRGKFGPLHHNWKGEASDLKGHMTTRRMGGGREFVHRKVMAEALGVPSLPKDWVVHHIDGNGENNHIDNLALATKTGHRHIHYLQVPETPTSRLRGLQIIEAVKFLTSQSKTTKAT
jgi:hypothetical protein